MNEQMNFDDMRYIIGSVVEYAYESIEDEKKEPGDFNSGRALAYYEVLDTIYSRLIICEKNPKDFGYPEDWEKLFFQQMRKIEGKNL